MENKKEEKAVFVGIIKQDDDERKIYEYLDELQFLAETAGAKGDKQFVQRVDRPDKGTYIRSGKLQEIADYCEENHIDYVIFDDELTGMQQRNIEKIIKTAAVIDRTSLILEIFSQRAQTAYAKTQVELAHYNYMLPRLAGMWTHLERQRGGMGTRGGMGETQIEVDRRIVRERIAKLKEQLKKVDKQMATQRSNRGQLVRLSLVGYTNAGKSTLLNCLTGADIPAKDRLFDTLDTTTRRLRVDESTEVLLSDTVGFIRKLPTHLIEAFKATLEELRYADVLLHVIDLSNPEWPEQARVVDALIRQLGAEQTPCLRVYNKCDAYFGILPHGEELVCISARSGEGTDALLEKLSALLDRGKRRVTLRIPYRDAGLVDLLQREAAVLRCDYTDEGVELDAVVQPELFGRVSAYIPGYVKPKEDWED